jgi:hypothetical protein
MLFSRTVEAPYFAAILARRQLEIGRVFFNGWCASSFFHVFFHAILWLVGASTRKMNGIACIVATVVSVTEAFEKMVGQFFFFFFQIFFTDILSLICKNNCY